MKRIWAMAQEGSERKPEQQQEDQEEHLCLSQQTTALSRFDRPGPDDCSERTPLPSSWEMSRADNHRLILYRSLAQSTRVVVDRHRARLSDGTDGSTHIQRGPSQTYNTQGCNFFAGRCAPVIGLISLQNKEDLSMAVSAGPFILSDLPVNLLSLDGGGIRGVSELFIRDEIMKRVQLRKNLPNTPKPCEYFDLIGGTSTGGEAKNVHRRCPSKLQQNLCRGIQFREQETLLQGWQLQSNYTKKEIQDVVCQTGYSNDQKLLDPDAGPDSKGNAFVCSVTGINRCSPQRFRTYQRLPKQGPDCKIWEAARATTAVPIFFKAIKITSGFGPDYVDAGWD
ncbi:acyl transferase/acyl hydrolase/lysophospholipase [Armillaria luteobubalina]|uniref:Acyl transferase/acyl hydrolase/lysophospholipase n=1 Tax=Armillaria luteobubalina TaxID=153913 RepID=A0AA39QHP0_9AGAR|nr:acyl transferase/acyl hydrolase/lysophospholipase [Armillaria luteobubalina]